MSGVGADFGTVPLSRHPWDQKLDLGGSGPPKVSRLGGSEPPKVSILLADLCIELHGGQAIRIDLKLKFTKTYGQSSGKEGRTQHPALAPDFTVEALEARSGVVEGSR